MKKKILIIIAAIVGLLLIALILVPIFYKDKVVALIKKEANKQLNAKLEFEDIGLSLFKNFPDFTLSIKNLTIINNSPFAGDTLVALANFSTTLDVMSLVRGQTIKVISITLDQPHIKLLALKDGTANWNITKESAQPAPEAEAQKNFNLALQQYAIKNGRLIYQDDASKMAVTVQGLDHQGSGDFTQDRFRLRTTTKIAALTLSSGGVKYLNEVDTRLKADVDVDAAAKKFTMLENELQLNNLFLTFNGSVAMMGQNTELDLQFTAPTNEFKNIISLIPAIYTKDFADLKSSGQLALQGDVKGIYNEKQYPAFNLQLLVNNGMFQYPKLPTAVNNVNMELHVNNPGGDLDNTVVDLKKFHVELGKEPFDANLLVKTPISDPLIAANIKGKINLGEIKNLMPLPPQTELAGVVTSDLRLAGNLSSLEKQQYQKFQAAGNVAFNNIAYSAAALPEKVSVPQARLSFSPANVTLSDLVCYLGKSDIQANGTLDNLLPYLMSDQTLQGTLSLNSKFFDLNPWMAGESSGLQAVTLPDKIEFTLNSAFQEVLYEKLKIQNVRGLLVLKDRTLHLMDLNMNLLNGSVTANGAYSTPENKPPHSFFDLKINELSFGQTFESFLTVQKFAPIAQSLNGNFSANLQLTTDLDSTLTPIWSVLNSKGALRIADAAISDFKPLTKMAEFIKMEKYKTLALQNLNPSYKIRDGRFFLEPLNFKVGNTDFAVVGSNGIDQSLDYSVKLRVPAKEMNTQANAAISQLFNKKVDLLQNDYVDLIGSIKGTFGEPLVKFSGSDLVKGATAQVTDLAKQQFQEKTSVVADTVNVELEKRKQELEKMKQAAADSAKRETDRLKEEAKKRLKKLFKP
jgi:AsmA-like C-terminal region